MGALRSGGPSTSAQSANLGDEVVSAMMHSLAREALEALPDLASKLQRAHVELLQDDYVDGEQMRDCYLVGTTEIVDILRKIRDTVTTVRPGFPAMDSRDESKVEREARRRFESHGWDSDQIANCARQIHTSSQRVLRALRIALNPILAKEDPSISAEASREAFRALPHVVDEARFEVSVARKLIDMAPFWQVEDQDGRPEAPS